MKIMFQYYNGGGGALENIMILLSRLAQDNPEDQYIIVCNKTSKLNELKSIPNVVIVKPKYLFHKELTRLYLGFFGLKKLVNILKPDVVWSMNLGSYVKINTVNILSVNNSHQVYPLKDTKSHPNSLFHVLLMRFFFRLSLRVANRIFTQTDVVKGYVNRIAPDKNITVFTKVVENEKDIKLVPVPVRVQVKLNSIKNTFSMLYVATNYGHKNHKVLIDALAILASENKNISLILSLTEDEAIYIGRDIAKQLIQSGHLCCIGWVDKNWLKHLYDFSSICLMPSILESLSSAYLEAMVWGVPQLVSNLPFAQETCRDAAIYCDPFNAEHWSQEVSRIMNDKSLYAQLQQKGLARIDEFPSDWTEVVNKYHNVFLEEVNKKGYNLC